MYIYIYIYIYKVILTLNNFQFNNDHYLQIKGTAMGTPVAPSYANIFMGTLDQIITSLPNNAILPGSWVRYIDDIQFIWLHSPRSLTKFHTQMNTTHPTIKFTLESSPDEIPFLDDTRLKMEGNKLQTELYTKPTDTHSYLLPTSSHPPHTLKSIPYSQALRVRRICSTPETEEHYIDMLQSHLENRQYDPHKTKTQIDRAKQIPREDLLKYKSKQPLQRTPPCYHILKSNCKHPQNTE